MSFLHLTNQIEPIYSASKAPDTIKRIKLITKTDVKKTTNNKILVIVNLVFTWKKLNEDNKLLPKTTRKTK